MSKLSPLKPRARILIVEDENIVALHLERSLNRLGYLIAGVVNSGTDAIKKAEEIRPDLILMDIQLKGEVDGIVAAQKIREWFQFPVVFLTAYSDEKTLERAKISEPYGYILKPFEESELSSTIEIVLHKHKMNQLQQQKSSRALKESEENFKLFVESVIDYGIFMLDPFGTVMSWNRGAERINGFKAEEIIGKSFSIFYLENDIQRGRPLEELRIAASEGHFEEEVCQVRKDKSTFWARVTIVPLRDEEGGIRGFGKIARDLTELKKAEDALLAAKDALEKRVQERTADLREALQTRDEFLSIASHELKNPLTSLSLQLQLLNRSMGENGKAPRKNRVLNGGDVQSPKKLVQACEAQSKRLNLLLDELLDLTRIRIGKFDLHKENVDLGSIITEVVGAKKVELTQSGSTVSIKADTPVVGNWDLIRVEQVIGNLLSNAIKYGDGKPIEISIEINPEKTRAILSVRDNGIGISREMQAKLFHRFERGDVTDKGISGLGLGLFIVQQIVKAHDGSISVLSDLDKGATFTVELPLDVSASEYLQADAPKETNSQPKIQAK